MFFENCGVSMNTLVLAAALLVVPVSTMAQAVDDGTLARRVQGLQDRAALKNLVDTSRTSPIRNETVYHINGQQTVDLRGDAATGVSYCLVVLIGVENGKRIKNTSGV